MCDGHLVRLPKHLLVYVEETLGTFRLCKYCHIDSPLTRSATPEDTILQDDECQILQDLFLHNPEGSYRNWPKLQSRAIKPLFHQASGIAFP